jgi:hypothetical protein
MMSASPSANARPCTISARAEEPLTLVYVPGVEVFGHARLRAGADSRLRGDGRQAEGIALRHGEIRRRMSAEESNRQLRRMGALGNLAANVSHDFNKLLVDVNECIACAPQRCPEVRQHRTKASVLPLSLAMQTKAPSVIDAWLD